MVSAETVASLSKAIGVPLDPSRFRANLILRGNEAWAEFEWLGQLIEIGGATLEVLHRTVRCDAVNVDARDGSGKADLDLPALLQKHFPQHGPYLGIYCKVVSAGTIHVGDRVVLREPAPAALPPSAGDASVITRATAELQQGGGTFAFAVGAVGVAVLLGAALALRKGGA